jgi:hypothetical protein
MFDSECYTLNRLRHLAQAIFFKALTVSILYKTALLVILR